MPQLSVTIESKLPAELFQVLASIGFWNTEGFRTYELNKKGELGSKASQDLARKLTYESFILDCLYADINCFATGSGKYWVEGYKFGKGGSHIWVSNQNNERVLFIHF